MCPMHVRAVSNERTFGFVSIRLEISSPLPCLAAAKTTADWTSPSSCTLEILYCFFFPPRSQVFMAEIG